MDLLSDMWQPVEARSWVQADIPAGWSVSVDANETVKPDNATISAHFSGYELQTYLYSDT